MRRYRRIRLLPLVLAAALFALGSGPQSAAAADKNRTGSQMEFGISMAKRGLWNEALFRFSRVLKERPGDARVLNNMAVAYEAIGEFDQALEHYKMALERDSGNRELRRNYAQFVEFYQGLKPDTAATEAEGEPKQEPADPDAEGAEESGAT